jgi:hypothetical protein
LHARHDAQLVESILNHSGSVCRFLVAVFAASILKNFQHIIISIDFIATGYILIEVQALGFHEN